jgi:hypothetical protein
MTDNPDPRAEKAPGPISDTSHAPFIYFSGGTRCRRRPAPNASGLRGRDSVSSNLACPATQSGLCELRRYLESSRSTDFRRNRFSASSLSF